MDRDVGLVPFRCALSTSVWSSPNPQSPKILRPKRQSVVGAAIEKAAKHTPRQLECTKIICLLALTNGRTERRIVEDGGLLPLVEIIRDGYGDGLGYAVSAVGHLAFVKENSRAIVESGVMVPLTNVLKGGDDKMQLRSVASMVSIYACALLFLDGQARFF